MAIRRIMKKKFKGVDVKSGYVYTFKYQAWENDPHPTVVMMYALEGLHPNTGHQWRFFQGINMTYVPRVMRRQFINDWKRILQSSRSVKFTWEKVVVKYPYLKNAVRRYFFRPTYYITDIKEIPFDDLEAVVVSTWSKDFSKKVKTSLIGKFRRVMRSRLFGGKKRR